MSEKIDNYLEIREKFKERRKVILYNIGQDFKSLYLFIIGIPLAIIFWLAWRGIDLSVGKDFPAASNISLILLMFLYACYFHDLVVPCLRTNYKKVPPLPK